jgi:hypothetical protein
MAFKKGNGVLILSIILFVLAVAMLITGFYYFKTTGYASSHVGNLSASITTYLTCTWSDASLDVSFGSNLNPGTNDINASKNYNETGSVTSYNVSVDVLSNVQANLTIKGENLVAGINSIGVTNVSWASNTSDGNGVNMIPSQSIALTNSLNTANKIAENEPVGSTVWYRFWLDIPVGQLGGNYKGNYTMQCEQAA